MLQTARCKLGYIRVDVAAPRGESRIRRKTKSFAPGRGSYTHAAGTANPVGAAPPRRIEKTPQNQKLRPEAGLLHACRRHRTTL